MQKQHHKKILGMLGLCAVALMTAVAASLPTPAGATSGISDTISITVVHPGADTTNIEDEMVVRNSMLEIKYAYVNVDHVTVEISWNAARARAMMTETLVDKDVTMSSTPVSESVTVDLNNLGGYNTYTITTIGYVNGMPYANAREFTYEHYTPIAIPTDKDVTTDERTGNPVINIEVTDRDVEYAKIEIYDESGALVETINEPVNFGSNSVTLDFASLGLSKGAYSLKVYAYATDPATAGATAMAEPVIYEITGYQGAWLPNVPDTGSLAYNLNISQSDYLLTGLVVFGLGIIGAAVLFKKSKNRR